MGYLDTRSETAAEVYGYRVYSLLVNGNDVAATAAYKVTEERRTQACGFRDIAAHNHTNRRLVVSLETGSWAVTDRKGLLEIAAEQDSPSRREHG